MTDKTREALEWFEMFHRRDGEDSNDCFERVAAVFHRDTGYLRPGKDCRMHSCEEREEAWDQWVAKNIAAARAALAAPVVEAAQTEPVALPCHDCETPEQCVPFDHCHARGYNLTTVPWPTVTRWTGGAHPEGAHGRVWLRIDDAGHEVEYVMAPEAHAKGSAIEPVILHHHNVNPIPPLDEPALLESHLNYTSQVLGHSSYPWPLKERRDVSPQAKAAVVPEAESRKIDEALGLFQLPPIRVDLATYAALQEAAKARGVVVQAIVREQLASFVAQPPAVEAEPVAQWQYRWLNPCDDRNISPSRLDWQPVKPDALQTMSEKVTELRAYKFLGKPCYEVRPLYAGPLQQPQEGWVSVPREPTEAMHQAAVRTLVRCSGNDDFPPRVWRAMIAAAAPSQGEGAPNA